MSDEIERAVLACSPDEPWQCRTAAQAITALEVDPARRADSSRGGAQARGLRGQRAPAGRANARVAHVRRTVQRLHDLGPVRRGRDLGHRGPDPGGRGDHRDPHPQRRARLRAGVPRRAGARGAQADVGAGRHGAARRSRARRPGRDARARRHRHARGRRQDPIRRPPARDRRAADRGGRADRRERSGPKERSKRGGR